MVGFVQRNKTADCDSANVGSIPIPHPKIQTESSRSLLRPLGAEADSEERPETFLRIYSLSKIFRGVEELGCPRCFRIAEIGGSNPPSPTNLEIEPESSGSSAKASLTEESYSETPSHGSYYFRGVAL